MMKKIIEVIFTSKTKDWKQLIRNWRPFYMLHLKDEHWIWYSKFYKDNSDIAMKIQVWQMFTLEVKQNWEYNNLLSLKDKDWNIII